MKRQRGRSRGGGGGGGGSVGGGGGKPTQNNVNRAFDLGGPGNVKIRGHAQHVYEKYQQLARDATLSGDRVLAENYLQHAEHYFRLIRSIQPQRPAFEIVGATSRLRLRHRFRCDESGGQEAAVGRGRGALGEGENEQGGGCGERQDRFEPRQDQRRFDSRGEGRRYERPGNRDDRQYRTDWFPSGRNAASQSRQPAARRPLPEPRRAAGSSRSAPRTASGSTLRTALRPTPGTAFEPRQDRYERQADRPERPESRPESRFQPLRVARRVPSARGCRGRAQADRGIRCAAAARRRRRSQPRAGLPAKPPARDRRGSKPRRRRAPRAEAEPTGESEES